MGESRTRQRQEPGASTHYQHQSTGVDNSWPINWTLAEEHIADVVTPNYQELIDSGEIINNPCTYSFSTREYPSGGYFRFKKNGSSYWYEQYPHVTLARFGDLSFTLASNPFEQARTDIAKLKALSHIDSSEYAFGEDAFEIRETLKFLRSPLQSLKELAHSFRRKKRQTLLQLNRQTRFQRKSPKKKRLYQAKAVANVWNSYRFAASPLVRSMVDAVDAMQSEHESPPVRQTARGYDYAANQTYADGVENSPGGNHWASREATYWSQQKASILYEVSNPRNDLPYIVGLRAKDFPYVLWQVLPLSFMVDRLVDISSAISALTNLSDPNVRILSACVVHREEVITSWKYVSAYPAGYTVQSLIGEEPEVRHYGYTRTIWSPSVLDAVPTFHPGKLIADVEETLDLISIVTSLLR